MHPLCHVINRFIYRIGQLGHKPVNVIIVVDVVLHSRHIHADFSGGVPVDGFLFGDVTHIFQFFFRDVHAVGYGSGIVCDTSHITAKAADAAKPGCVIFHTWNVRCSENIRQTKVTDFIHDTITP